MNLSNGNSRDWHKFVGAERNSSGIFDEFSDGSDRNVKPL